jgi:hypothetical protein
MQEQIQPRKVCAAVKAGFERLRRYRKARAMFIAAYVGQYYREEFGLSGKEPLNLLFAAIRALIPNIISNNPICQITTDVLQYKVYAELLSLGLTSINKKMNLKRVLRAAGVSAMFAMAVAKTSIASSGVTLDVENGMDPGQLYTELVDLDDFVMGATARAMTESPFLGHRVLVPRQYLLDTDTYQHDLVVQLPSAGTKLSGGERPVISLSQTQTNWSDDLQDMVHAVELWIPGANATVTIPDPDECTFDDYLGVNDFYGPDSGPYSFLALTPPVEGNPLPVAPASMVFDLHNAANSLFRKLLKQVERQKDLLLYDPAHSDVAQDIVDSDDGDTIAASNPKDAINAISIGGKNQGNSDMLGQLQLWFNYMAGNPDQMSGNRSNAKTATQANILQGNASVSIEDARGLIYDFTADITDKQRWYLHTDPLMNIPLARREPGGDYTQLFLTPEQRRGEFVDFVTHIVAKSMSVLDPVTRSRQIIMFCTNVMPQAAMVAQTMMSMGQQFNLQRYLTRVSGELGIGDWVEDLFQDPEFEQKMQIYLSMGPQSNGKAIPGQSMDTMQNGGFPVQQNVMRPEQDNNQLAQEGANQGQQNFEGNY